MPGSVQAAGRVWRDGQKKRVYVYRFLATGTIEEKARLLSLMAMRLLAHQLHRGLLLQQT